MKIFKKNKVPTKKTAMFFFAVSVLVLVVCYGITQSMLMRFELENFRTEIMNDTKKNVSSAKNLLDEMVADLEDTAKEIEQYDDLKDPEVRKILEFSHKMNPFDVTFIADDAGNSYADGGYEFNVADQEYFNQAMEGELIFSEILPSKRFEAIQIIAYPLRTDAQEVKGVLFGLFNAATFSQLINSVLEYDNEYIYVVDPNGNYINCFDKEDTDTESEIKNFWKNLKKRGFDDSTIAKIQENFQAGKEGDFSYSYNGIQRYGCHMPLGIQNWQIVLTVKETVMNSHIHSIHGIVTMESVINVICLIVMLMCSYFYFKNMNLEMQKVNQKISKNNEMMRIAVESSDYIIFEYDINERKIELKTQIANPLFNSPVISNVPECFIDSKVIFKDSIAAIKKLFKTIETEEDSQADIQMKTKNREKVWYRVSMHNIYDEKGRVVGTVGSAEDISMLKKGEAAIRRKVETDETLITNVLLYARVDLSTDAVLELNGKETYKSYQNYLYKNIIESASDKYQAYVAQELSLESLNKAYQQGKETKEVQYTMKCAGSIKWVTCVVYRVHMSDSSKVTLVVMDIDEKKRETIALMEQAERDGLTGLYNAATTRFKMSKILESMRSSKEKAAFILLDLDNFKQINDTFGHACGDQVLIDMANILHDLFSSKDIVGRLGGDEFAIMLNDSKSIQQIHSLINTMNDLLTKIYTQKGISVTVSASIGVAIAPKDGTEFKDLYQKADVELYKIKKAKKV